MAKSQRFKAVVTPSRRGSGGHLIEVPAGVVTALGGKGRTPIRASFNGVPYRGSIMRMGGVDMIGVTKAIMAEAGVAAGDKLDVVVEVDDRPREVDVPGDFAKALRRAGLTKTFDAMAFSHKREHVEAVLEAKREETRKRRIDKAIEMIADRKKKG